MREKDFQSWSDAAKIAFWSNAYNAFTLQAIIDRYPIQSSWLKSRIYPKNSIRQISGVWDELQFRAAGKKHTLEAIEHEMLRAQFDEPRIHMALVCASIGCPLLRNEPFTAENLEKQLDDQSEKFVAHARNFRLDRNGKAVHLSSIFKWYGGDWLKKYAAPAGKFAGQDPKVASVLHFVSQYVSEGDRAFLESGGYSVSYLDYDWSLNEQ